MNAKPPRASSLLLFLRPLALATVCSLAATATARAAGAKVLEVESIVEAASRGRTAWTPAVPNQALAVGDSIRTGEYSRATIRLSELYNVRLDELTTIEITPAALDPKKSQLNLPAGAAFIFSRERSGEIDVKMPAVNAGMKGTRIFARVLPGGRSFVQVLEGKVELENSHGRLPLLAGQAGEAMPGQAPHPTAVIDAHNILQWALYYPAVVDLADLHLNPAAIQRLGKSGAAYQRGNLLAAAAALPNRAAATTSDRTYQAAVLLAVGRVDQAHRLLAGVPRGQPGRRALERMIAAVRWQAAEEWPLPTLTTASEALAESYYLQSQTHLEPARLAALRATELAPHNGFAWTRVAELEFSTGHTKAARVAIEKGLALTPENARAHALRGFILSAENRIGEAQTAFQHAVRLDGGFGNGWLGLGLTKIKLGHLEDGRADLQTAATVEPTSSIFHSYLGKAFSQEGLADKAALDLKQAALLDPADPTPLLYSALENQRRNRTNTAIAELEQSIQLNDNRRLYRSRFLLDQDRAVRGANLARIYQNAGMKEVALREATRAVERDYTNPSAHLFLANSFDAMRDPDRVQLRHETPWFTELLLSNLLSPVGGGPLSQFVSQQEYSKLLEADGIGGSTTTEWRSSSEIRSTASVFGTHGNVSYGVDAYYRNDDGDRFNSAQELQEIYGQFKWQATPDDLVYFLGKWSTQNSGDTTETFDNRPLSPGLNFEENQEPGLLLGGWNHRWAPGSNTLLLVGRLGMTQYLTDPSSSQLISQRDTNGMRPGFIRTDANGFDEFTDPALRGSVGLAPDGESLTYSPELRQAISPFLGSGDLLKLSGESFDFSTRRELEIVSAELQHIFKTDRNTLLVGGRWQEGTIDTSVRMSVRRPTNAGGFTTPAADQQVESDYRRTALYAYDYWRALPSLTLIGGVAWDSIDHPANFRNPPVSTAQREEDELSGKLGFTWTPGDWLTLRGAAAQGLGGLSFDESVRLEPLQIAGFNQAYRTVISESLVGSVETPTFQTIGLGAEGQLSTRTWWGVTASAIEQEVDRTRGLFTGYDSMAFVTIDAAGNVTQPNTLADFPDGTPEHLDYEEQTLALTLNQLVGDEFSIGAGYRLTRSELRNSMPALLSQPGTRYTDEATLHEFSLYGNWNSPLGYFARLEANWFQQDLTDDPTRAALGEPVRSGDEFFQINAWLGYRFNDNLCELTAGVLNLGDQDYQLSPLSPYAEIVRSRTFFMLCRVSF